MKILMVYPKYPDTFWSFRHALRFIDKKAAFPPLGLVTVAPMLPLGWDKKLVDMNTDPLNDQDILWADYVFISAMAIQSLSARQVISRAHSLGIKVVAGGPLVTANQEKFCDVEHLVLDEAEVTLPLFLADLAKGKAKRIYMSKERPDITRTPLPEWSLINMKKYATMSVQYSRGCPYDCEFCDIVVLNGRNVRTKTTKQFIAEMDALYFSGWRGSVLVVDDNFIGNKKKLKDEILPALIEWMEKRGYPFSFSTEASINLADDEELMTLMIRASFGKVFIGIETTDEGSLNEANKFQNKGRDLADSVRIMQNHGFEVQGGFIVGFDSDPVSIFRSQATFIQNTGIVAAMVGLLNAPRGTRLWQRLKKENRLVDDISGDNTDCSLNFIPKMDPKVLTDGYKSILEIIYSPPNFYRRIATFLREYRQPKQRIIEGFHFYYVLAFFRMMWTLGVSDRGRKYFWQMVISTARRRPRALIYSFSLAVLGLHFRIVASDIRKTC